MANPLGKRSITPTEQQQMQDLAKQYTRDDGTINISGMAKALGIPRPTIQNRLRRNPINVEFPSFVTEGDEEEDIEDVLNRKSKHFERKQKAAADRDWFPIKIKESQPYGLLCFGDTHLDDDGANIPLLRKHAALAAQDGIYGLNIGDVSNNWVGRLERLYAHQETSRNTGRRLVQWFMWDSGVKWVCWILGNHDIWNEGADFHMRLADRKIPVLDWRAQFKLVHPNGTECRIDASHGRKGSSIWNNLHATLRSARLGEVADAFLTGHTHNYGLEDLEIAERRIATWLVQLRGYKHFDSYALHSNFAEYQRGAAVLLIIDPRKDAKRPVMQCFDDVDVGYRFLQTLRSP